MFKVCRHLSQFVTFLEDYNRYRVEIFFTKTALAQGTILATAASLVTVPPLYQVNGKTVLPENHR